MSEMVLLHCGLNDFTTGPMPLRTAVAYIVEAVEDGMDCVGTHEVLEPVEVVLVDESDEAESAIEWLRSRLQ